MALSTSVIVWNAGGSPPVPQAGAQIYLDGRSLGVTGDNGSLVIVIPADGSNHEITASYPGLATGSTLVQPTPSIVLYLHSDAVAAPDVVAIHVFTAGQDSDLSATEPAAGAEVTISDGSGASVDTLVTDPQGNTQTSQALDVGATYTFSVTLDGYEPYSSSVQIQQHQTLGLGPLVQSADDQQIEAQTPEPVGPTAAQIAARLSNQPDPNGEYIYPNTVDGRYFTTSQARVYIGDVFIDEVNYVQFTLQDNKIPIFPYNARFMAAVGQGRSLVQGQLGLNFVSEGYLYLVLKEYAKLSIDADLDPSEQAAAEQQETFENLQLMRQAILSKSRTALTLADLSDLDTINQEIKLIAATLGPAGIDQLKSTLAQQAAPDKFYSNALYLDVPFDIVFQYSGGGRTVTRKLEKCFLTGNDMVHDQSGQALVDGYSFIARRLQ